MPYAVEAPFNSYTARYKPTCLPDTCVDILQEIFSWADVQDDRCIFFSRGVGDVGHAGQFFTSIAVQLADNVPALQRYICEAIEAITEQNDITSQSLHDQWRQLVLRPLSKLDDNSCPSSHVLVIDALDECDGDNDIQVILQLLAEARSLKTVRLRVFITSRPEIPIRYGFYGIPDAEH